MARPTVYLCGGSACRERDAERKVLKSALKASPVVVVDVGCQKICKGPVAGCAVGGHLEWFKTVDSVKAVAAFVELARTGAPSDVLELSKPLRKRHVPKRSGKLRD